MGKVREKRMAKGLSQKKLAAQLGVSVGFIGKVESEGYDTHYNIRHLNDLAAILECSPKEFWPENPI